MQSDRVLVVSGSATKDGGLFVVDGDRVEVIDRVKTHGLSMRADELYRLVTCNNHAIPRTDLFVYDRDGVRAFYRLDGVWDAHDVLARERDVLVVCSGNDSVYALTADGAMRRWWTAGSRDGDRHLNCLSADSEGVVATELGWWKHDPDATSGRLFRLPSEESICEGLSQPHTPRFIDGAWVVANSRRRALQAYGARGELLQQRTFAGFTRGLAFDERYLYLGESTERIVATNSLTEGRITILERRTWDVVDTISLPTSNVYDVVLAPRALVAGLRTGFRRAGEFVDDYAAVVLRTGVQQPAAWAIADPLPPAALGVSIELEPPRRMQLDEIAIVRCKVTNTGAATYASAPPNPIVLCYRWYDNTGSAVGAGTWLHSPLPAAIGAGETIDAAMRIATPDRTGTYTIAVTLLQEGVAWFDDLNPAFGIRAAVAITEA